MGAGVGRGVRGPQRCARRAACPSPPREGDVRRRPGRVTATRRPRVACSTIWPPPTCSTARRRAPPPGPSRAGPGPRDPDHLLAEGVHPPDDAVPGPVRLLHVRQGPGPASTSPYLTPDEVLAIARRGAEAGCHEALFTLGERPEERYPVAARLAGRARLRARPSTTWSAMCRLVLDETGLLPHANAGALFPDELAALRPVTRQPGDDDRDAAGRSGRPPGLARQDAGAPAGHPGGGRRARHPVHDRDPGRHRRGPGPTGSTALEAIAAAPRRHGHVQEVIVQNFLPKPGTAMHRAPPCPTDEFLWTPSPLARLILPPEIHLQAPPNLSDDFGALLDAGIDDWGGVSPVTADHVNPERPWPALERLRAVTEAAGLHPGAPADDLPRVRRRPEPVAGRGHALRRSSTAATPRAWPATTRGGVPQKVGEYKNVATAPRWCWSAGARPVVLRRRRRPAGAAAGARPPGARSAEVLAGVRLGPGARRRRDRHAVRAPGAPRWRRWPRWPTSCAPKPWATP